MKSREPVEVQIDHLDLDGCGYSSDNKLAVYGALAGEQVIASPLARKRKRLYLKATEILEPSGDRVTPACGAAAHCGGCVFQHLVHGEQLTLKQDYLARELAPITPVSWLAPMTGPLYNYRSKARLGVKYVEKKGRVLVGFREKQKPYIADILACPVLSQPVDELLQPLARLVEQLSIPRSIPQVEVAVSDLTALIIRHLEPFNENDKSLLAEFEQRHSVMVLCQPGGMDTIHPLTGEEQWMKYHLPEFELEFLFQPTDFTQVNQVINRQMVRRAVDLLAPGPGDRVLDAFCGIGNFSLAIARTGASVVGVEYSESSVSRAGLNARHNRLEMVRFEVANLHSDAIKTYINQSYNKVLLDPPRSGAEALVKGLASGNVERVVYVSCNPETLARDVKILVGEGFQLQSAGIIDMFPHTSHVESIALLTRPVSAA